MNITSKTCQNIVKTAEQAVDMASEDREALLRAHRGAPRGHRACAAPGAPRVGGGDAPPATRRRPLAAGDRRVGGPVRKPSTFHHFSSVFSLFFMIFQRFLMIFLGFCGFRGMFRAS